MVGTSEQLLKQDQIDLVFSSIEDIYRINSEFLSELEQRILHEESETERDILADLFLVKIPDFATYYTPYVHNHQESIMLLRQLDKKSTWTAFLQSVKDKGEIGKLDISSYLILPVQRIPRYELLLKDLSKWTTEDHNDFKDLKQTIKEICDITTSVNASMRKHEDLKKLVEIEKNISGYNGSIAVPDRLLIKEGPLWKVCRKIPKKRYFYLFSDLLIYTSLPNQLNEQKFKRQYSLREGKTKIRDLKDTGELKNAFQIVGSDKSFSVYTDTIEEKQSWMRAFHNLLSSSSSIQVKQVSPTEQFSIEAEEAPVWIPDSKTKFCMLCGLYFTVVRRRHHCRNCGKVICGACSDYKRKLSYSEGKELRVCRICYNFLQLKDDPKDNTTTTPVSPTPSSPSSRNHASISKKTVNRSLLEGSGSDSIIQMAPIEQKELKDTLSKLQLKKQMSSTSISTATSTSTTSNSPNRSILSKNASFIGVSSAGNPNTSNSNGNSNGNSTSETSPIIAPKKTGSLLSPGTSNSFINVNPMAIKSNKLSTSTPVFPRSSIPNNEAPPNKHPINTPPTTNTTSTTPSTNGNFIPGLKKSTTVIISKQDIPQRPSKPPPTLSKTDDKDTSSSSSNTVDISRRNSSADSITKVRPTPPPRVSSTLSIGSQKVAPPGNTTTTSVDGSGSINNRPPRPSRPTPVQSVFQSQ